MFQGQIRENLKVKLISLKLTVRKRILRIFIKAKMNFITAINLALK